MTALLFCLWLQAAGTPPEPAQTGIQGVVLNAITKEAVRKAEVQLQPMRRSGPRQPGEAGGYAVVTNSAGEFSAMGMEPGEYLLTAIKTGFLGGRYGAKGSGPGTVVAVTAGQAMKGIEIALTPQGVISGRVVDEDGDPLPHVSVGVMQQRTGGGRRQLQRSQTSGGNDKGEFRIANLAPGKYLLAAEAMTRGPGLEQPSGTKGPESGYRVTYFPGVIDAAQAVPIEVQAGQELTGFEIMMRKGTVFRVRGRMVDGATGQPAERAYVFLVARDDLTGGGDRRQWGAARMTQGGFEITGVPSGSYLLIAQKYDQNERLGAMMPVEVGSASVDGLTVTLQAGITLQGRIVIESQQKVPVKDIRVRLSPTNGVGVSPPQNPETKEDGTFAVKDVLPGSYRVNAMGPGMQNLYLAMVRYGDQDYTFQPLDFSSGAGGPLTLIFRGDGGSVSGMVRDGDQAAANAMALLLPIEEERRPLGGARLAPVNGSGSFEAKNLRPGDYYAIAAETLEPGIWDDPEWMRTHQSEMTKVTVSPGGSVSVQLKCAR